MAADVALHHHEMWNGRGYPLRKAGEAIPLAGRIVAIVDFFDLCISPKLDTAYRVVSPNEAFGLVEEASGTYFDPALAKIFLAHREEFMDLL